MKRAKEKLRVLPRAAVRAGLCTNRLWRQLELRAARTFVRDRAAAVKCVAGYWIANCRSTTRRSASKIGNGYMIMWPWRGCVDV